MFYQLVGHYVFSEDLFWHTACFKYHHNVAALIIKQEVPIMETSMISVFAGLSILLGLMVGFGTLSLIRGLFTFLLFMGLALSAFLNTIGVNEIISYFLGQMITMGSTYILLRSVYPEALLKVKQELKMSRVSVINNDMEVTK
jgi:hypothetical protein